MSGDEPSSPLQQASKLLSDMNAELQFNLTGLDGMNDPQKAGAAPVVSTPTMDAAARNGGVRASTSAGPNPALVYPKMSGELEPVVYPVGATNGIDPMYSEHVNNVPYAMPPKTEIESTETRRQYPDNRKKSTNVDPGWMRSPHILLVEDDATCRQIGGKFLYSFNCVIDTAVCDPFHLQRILSLTPHLVQWSRSCEQDPGRLEIRSDSYGYHYASSRRCISMPPYPASRPNPHHRHDLQHSQR